MPTVYKLQKWQEDIIRDNLITMPPAELAKKANVGIKVIYNRRRARSGWIEPDLEVSEVQKIVRPPAVYSNRISKYYD